MNNVWVKIKEINELCGVVNFSSHNQMREAIEGTMEITETLLSEQPSQSNVSEDVVLVIPIKDLKERISKLANHHIISNKMQTEMNILQHLIDYYETKNY